MFRRTLTKTHHTRLFTIQKLTDAGWELRIEQDSRTVRTARYSDWHRVERACRALAMEVARLEDDGWIDPSAYSTKR